MSRHFLSGRGLALAVLSLLPGLGACDATSTDPSWALASGTDEGGAAATQTDSGVPLPGDAAAAADGTSATGPGAPPPGDDAGADGAPVSGPNPPAGDDSSTDETGPSTPPDASSGQPTLPNGRGATLPYVEYEAEAMTTNGMQLGPSRTFGDVAAEASGRQAVRLSNAGQSVQFVNGSEANSIVVRYSIPDSGLNYWTTLSVYVNGTARARLSVTSRYSWSYGGDSDFNTPAQKNPASGSPHHYFDEARALIGDVPAGATVEVLKDNGDNAAYYDIDLVDMELVPPPLAQPAGYLSLTADCGVAANDTADHSADIQTCVDRAHTLGRGVYIPSGTFNSLSKPISVSGTTIRGAGMWYSTINGYNAHFDCYGNNCQYYAFAVSGDSTIRDDAATDTAFGGNGSSGVVLDGIWIEHTKTGYWPGASTNNLTIRNSRIRDLWADGVNLWGGTTNSLIQNNHARNTGDDAFAAWSQNATGLTPSGANTFSHNTVQVPWKANCFGIYGGNGNHIDDNVCFDVVQYPGILLARQFDSFDFTGDTQVDRNTLIRAGAWAYNQEQGAFKVHADQAPVQNITVTDLDIISPTYFGVHVQGTNAISAVSISNATISNPAEGAFFLNSGSNGSMSVDNVVVTGSPLGVRDDSKGAFTLVRGAGNSGW